MCAQCIDLFALPCRDEEKERKKMSKKKKIVDPPLPPDVRAKVKEAYALVAPLRRKRRLSLRDFHNLRNLGTRLNGLQAFNPHKIETTLKDLIAGSGFGEAYVAKPTRTYIKYDSRTEDRNHGAMITLQVYVRVRPEDLE